MMRTFRYSLLNSEEKKKPAQIDFYFLKAVTPK